VTPATSGELCSLADAEERLHVEHTYLMRWLIGLVFAMLITGSGFAAALAYQNWVMATKMAVSPADVVTVVESTSASIASRLDVINARIEVIETKSDKNANDIRVILEKIRVLDQIMIDKYPTAGK